MKTNIATVFDKNHIVKTVAFYNTLTNLGNYTFWFLCIDSETKKIMMGLNLPHVTLITPEEIGDQEFLNTRTNRSFAEFVFTSKSVFVNYILNKIKDGEALIYSDNDIIYFSSPEDLLTRMKNEQFSIGIVPHKFPNKNKHMEKVGRYNAGLLYLIADENSRACISDWRKDCIEWCYLIYEKERFGDQKYIDKWAQKYQGVYEIPDKGINLGSWNIFNFKITKKDNNFFVDTEILVCYHFHRIKFYIDYNKVKPLPIYVYHKELYEFYRINIENAWKKILTIDKNWKFGFVEKPTILRIIKQITTRLIRNATQNIKKI